MVVLFVMALAGTSYAQPGFLVDIPADEATVLRAMDEPTVMKQRFVDVQFEPIEALATTEDPRLRMDLFGDLRPIAVFDGREDRSLESYSLFGSVEGIPGSNVILVKHHDVIFAQFDLLDDGLYQVRFSESGRHEVVEIDRLMFPPCATGPEHAVAAPHDAHEALPGGENGAGPRSDDGTLIDVLVLYTPAARANAGGTNSIQSLIIAAVNATNNAYNNSNVNPRLRLVHMAETDYTESGNASTDLSRLRGNGNGYMDEAHTLRNTHGADLVALIINNASNACGVAYLLTSMSPSFQSNAFSVTVRSCAVGNMTFAHELGHNQGCHHDRDNAGSAIYPYSYGWRFVAGSTYRTVMAYSPGIRISYFSNPDVLFNGVPTGVPIGEPLQAHNAQTLNNTALLVSQFRKEVVFESDPPSPDPMGFLNPPTATGTGHITMTALTATDETTPIRYFFEETTGNPGAYSSNWQMLTLFTNSGLTPNTQYGYRVKARDDQPEPNETAFSDVHYAVTRIQTPGAVVADEVSHHTVQLTASGTFPNLTLEQSGIYFEADPPGDYDGIGVWSQSNTIVVDGLLGGRTYSFRAKARNQEGVETVFGPWAVVETVAHPGDCNDDGYFNIEGDLPCFVEAMLGIESIPGAIDRSDLNLDGHTDALDIQMMVDCLVSGCN